MILELQSGIAVPGHLSLIVMNPYNVALCHTIVYYKVMDSRDFSSLIHRSFLIAHIWCVPDFLPSL